MDFLDSTNEEIDNDSDSDLEEARDQVCFALLIAHTSLLILQQTKSTLLYDLRRIHNL